MGCNFLVFKLKERVSLSIVYKMCVCHYNINRKMGDFYFGRKCYKAPVGCCKAGLVMSDKQFAAEKLMQHEGNSKGQQFREI